MMKKMMSENPEEIQLVITKRTVLVALLPLLSSLIMGEISSLIGLLLGLIISLLLFRLKLLNIRRALEMNRHKAEVFIRNRYFINYIIYFAVMYTAQRKPEINFLAVLAGLLLLKFTIIGSAAVEIITDKWRKKLDSFKGGIIDESRT